MFCKAQIEPSVPINSSILGPVTCAVFLRALVIWFGRVKVIPQWLVLFGTEGTGGAHTLIPRDHSFKIDGVAPTESNEDGSLQFMCPQSARHAEKRFLFGAHGLMWKLFNFPCLHSQYKIVHLFYFIFDLLASKLFYVKKYGSALYLSTIQ